jgi:Na+/melibiose symporter-like transporter
MGGVLPARLREEEILLGQRCRSRYTAGMVFILKLLLAIGTGFVIWALL